MSHNSKLNEQTAAKIRKLFNTSKISISELADQHGVTSSTITRILRNEAYNDPSYKPTRCKTLIEAVAEVMELREQGKTLAAIGKELGAKYRTRAWTSGAVASALEKLAEEKS